MANDEQVKGWFKLPGQKGDRTLAQQLRGLDPLFAEVAGKSVLDIGAAEGLISIELAKAGAARVRGVEVVKRYIPIANKLKGELPCKFVHADANDYAPKMHDIVIALALLHKLRDPSGACMRFAAACRDLMVIRLPPSELGAVILDERSYMQPHDIGKAMLCAGFKLERRELGPFDEPTFYYRRKR